MKFIDETELSVQSGNGGNGCASFRREKYLPRGGPDGGNGGAGGSVIVRVNPRLHSLIDLYSIRKLAAKNGAPGQGQNKAGSDGSPLVIDVPPGTIIYERSDGDDHQEQKVLADLEEGEVILLEGGRGGKGNAHFTTSVNQAPTHAQKGESGSSLSIKLELKLIADVGLVGFPNAGKSTLISRVSAAKPKIADYPFTTLTPNLGVVSYGSGDSFVVADIPGLIPGAHEGTGLGIQFLRHIERTKVFVHLVDVSGLSGRDPLEDYYQIHHELEMYDKKNQDKKGRSPLLGRKQLLVLNKIDAIPREELEDIKLRFLKAGLETLEISAVSGQGIKELVTKMGREVFAE